MPDLRRARRKGDDPLAVWTKLSAFTDDGFTEDVPEDRLRDRLSSVSVPDTNSFIMMGRENLLPVRTESCGVNLPRSLGQLG